VQTTADGKPQKVCFKAMRFTQAGIQAWARPSPGGRRFCDDGKNTVIPAKAGIPELCK
jgi:hypothetical protein